MSAYEVRVSGVVKHISDVGVGLRPSVEHETVLRGELASADDLYRLIGRLYDLGLDVIDVRHYSRPSPPALPEDSAD